jgi:UDP-glucose 4-epimerase
MHYLVTGGAGFIGSHLVDRLVADGHRVRVLDNFSTGKNANLADVAASPLLEVIEGDIRDGKQVERAIAGVDGIFHLAALVSVQQSVENPYLCFDINARGSVNLLDAARRAGVKRLVLASSAAVYGDSNVPPLHESMYPKPMSPYALDKLYMEQVSAMYSVLYGMHTTLLRFFNVYGPRQVPDSPYSGVISIFISRATRGLPVTIYGDGAQTRDFVHVRDVVRANILAMQGSVDGCRILNVATGMPVTVGDLAKRVFQVCNRVLNVDHAPPRSKDIVHSYAEVISARNQIGFSAEISIESGLRSLYSGSD